MQEKELVDQSKSILEQAKELVVFSKEDSEKATGLLKLVLGAKKMIKDYWKDPKEKANQVHKAVTAKENEMLSPILQAEKAIKDQTSRYATEVRKKEMEAEAKLREQAKENDVKVEVKVEREKVSGQTTKETWYVEHIDREKLPKEYWVIDMDRLDSIAKSEKGKAVVPGVRFDFRLRAETRR